MIMSVFEVGKPLFGFPMQFPEMVLYEFGSLGHLVVVFRKDLTDNQAMILRRGEFEVAYVREKSLLHFLFRCPSVMDWDFGTYAWHALPREERVLPVKTFKEGLGINLMLIFADANTSVVKGMRTIGLATEFSRKFSEAIWKQSEEQFDERLYERYLSEQDLVKPAEIVQRAEHFCCVKGHLR